MRNYRKRGATLSLVAVVLLVIIMIGVATFFLAKIVGGARELQHATDAGNLNVAKASLRNPHVKIFASSGSLDLSGDHLNIAKANFEPDVDKVNGEIDLLNFNKIVGHAMLVAMNATSDNYGSGAPPDSEGIANARTLLDSIYNQDYGIGTILANKLKADPIQDNNFLNIATAFPMRMLNPGGAAANTLSVDKDISFMVPGTAMNLLANTTMIPPEYIAMDPGFVASSTVTSNGRQYFKGYKPLSVLGITDGAAYPLMGVCMRPGDKPHLVNLQNFSDLKVSPLPGDSGQPAQSRIPPNAFKNKGWSNEIKSTQALQTLSCAITGTVGLSGEYPPSIPCGYLVIANGGEISAAMAKNPPVLGPNAGGLSGYGYSGGSGDIFTDVLMYHTVYISDTGAMSEDPSAIPDIQQFKRDHPGEQVPSDLANRLKGPGNLQDLANGINPNGDQVPCDNHTSAHGPQQIQRCIDSLPAMASLYGTNLQSGNNGALQGGLMSIEKEKADVIGPRPYSDTAVVSGLQGGVCTGMKAFSLGGISASEPPIFGRPPTVLNLIQSFQNYGGTAASGVLVYNQISTKIKQMRPQTSQAEIDAVLSNPVPMGSVKFIWVDKDSGALKFTDASNLPNWINPANIHADGSSVLADTGWIPTNRTFVNIEGEQSFPSPWDCFGGPGQTDSKMQWTRSSGFNCLQGILRFQNCTQDGGGAWQCPC